MKRRIETGDLRHARQLVAERFDERDLARQVARIERNRPFQFGDERLGDPLMLDKLRPAVDDPMPDADKLSGRQRLAEPFDQSLRGLFMIRRGDFPADGRLTVGAGDDKRCARQPDSFNLAA